MLSRLTNIQFVLLLRNQVSASQQDMQLARSIYDMWSMFTDESTIIKFMLFVIFLTILVVLWNGSIQEQKQLNVQYFQYNFLAQRNSTVQPCVIWCSALWRRRPTVRCICSASPELGLNNLRLHIVAKIFLANICWWKNAKILKILAKIFAKIKKVDFFLNF